MKYSYKTKKHSIFILKLDSPVIKK
jgi:hypothetical protein